MSLNKKASRLFLICLALFLGLSLAAGIVVELVDPENVELTFILSSVVSVLSFLVPALIFRRRNELPRFKAPRFGHIVIAVILGVGAIYLNEALSFLNEAIFFNFEVESNATTAETIMGISVPTMIVSLAIIPPISEEFIMRGALLESWRRYSPVGAAILTSVLFALLHTAPSALIVYIGIGLLLASIYLITRNVWMTVIVHFVNNFFTALAAIALKSADLLPETAEESAELAEIGGLDIDTLAQSQEGLFRLFIVYTVIATFIIVPMIAILVSSCKKRKLGKYVPATEETIPEATEETAIETAEPEEKTSMWNDLLLWITIILLVVLNVISGLFEFGVIKQ